MASQISRGTEVDAKRWIWREIALDRLAGTRATGDGPPDTVSADKGGRVRLTASWPHS